jgi:hypothetical protein
MHKLRVSIGLCTEQHSNKPKQHESAMYGTPNDRRSYLHTESQPYELTVFRVLRAQGLLS